MGSLAWVPAFVGFWLGILFLLLLDSLLPHLHLGEKDDRPEGLKSNLQRKTLMLLAVTSGKGEWRGERVRTFGPLRVVRRASSRILQGHDSKVLAALDLIRRRACSGLRAEEVARLFDCSRRMADIRFARAVGRSILAEIHAVQLERAQELIRSGNMPLKAISDFCGFTNPNSLRKFFRRETGMSMSAWRHHK